jgi:hypothetical protein
MASIISAGTTSGTALNMAGDTSGVLQLATNGSTTAITINTSQDVGIGTASPAEKLNVVGSSTNAVGMRVDNTQSSTVGTVYNTSTTYSYSGIGASTTWFYGNKTVAVGTDSANPVQFICNNAERMRITSSGNVVIGDTATPVGAASTSFYVKQPSADYSAYFLSSNATAANCYGPFIQYSAAAPNGTGNEFFAAVDSAVTRMTVRSNGGIANYSGNNVNLSDQREKTNIELAGSYLDKVCAIPVKTFNYIDQNMEEDGGLTLGVIAQDVQAVAPELVSESNWGTEEEPKQRLSIYQTDLQYALMKCIQEQQTIINDLKARITALEGAA